MLKPATCVHIMYVMCTCVRLYCIAVCEMYIHVHTCRSHCQCNRHQCNASTYINPVDTTLHPHLPTCGQPSWSLCNVQHSYLWSSSELQLHKYTVCAKQQRRVAENILYPMRGICTTYIVTYVHTYICTCLSVSVSSD